MKDIFHPTNGFLLLAAEDVVAAAADAVVVVATGVFGVP